MHSADIAFLQGKWESEKSSLDAVLANLYHYKIKQVTKEVLQPPAQSADKDLLIYYNDLY